MGFISLCLNFLQNDFFISIDHILQNKPVSFVSPGRATLPGYLSTVALTQPVHVTVSLPRGETAEGHITVAFVLPGAAECLVNSRNSTDAHSVHSLS